MLPNNVLEKIGKLNLDNKSIINSARDINYKYRNESGKNKVLVSSDLDSQAYSVYRMPSTYEACYNVFNQISKIIPDTNFDTLLDVGSGTGASTLACIQNFSFNKVMCYERELSMINCAKTLLSDYVKEFNINWEQKDLLKSDLKDNFDMIISSYVLNEFDDANRLATVKKLWNLTKKIFIVIEPGTTEGYRQIKQIRETLIKEGAYIVAPCTHSNECPLSKDDWCNFSCRVPRTKLMKQIKNAEVPYEDEKYCYMAFSKQQYEITGDRIIRHPYYRPKVVEMEICNKDGIKKIVITKKDKEYYREARNAQIGDIIRGKRL